MYRTIIIAGLFAGSAMAAVASPLTQRSSCSTPDGSGSCTSTSSCSGFSVAGYCPGAADIQCCVSKTCSTSSGSGTCLNTGNGCSGGSFVSGACPGDSSVQCCVKGGSSGGGGGSSGGGSGQIDQAAISLIESLEGFSANFYDINGDETIGYGHDCTQQGDCSSISAPISQAQGQALLMNDLKSFESCVCALPNASGLNMNQFGALVSFTYNSGCGGVQEYFTSYMDDSNFSGICSALPSTNTLGGELDSRRQKEGAFCSQSTSTKSGC